MVRCSGWMMMAWFALFFLHVVWFRHQEHFVRFRELLGLANINKKVVERCSG